MQLYGENPSYRMANNLRRICPMSNAAAIFACDIVHARRVRNVCSRFHDCTQGCTKQQHHHVGQTIISPWHNIYNSWPFIGYAGDVLLLRYIRRTHTVALFDLGFVNTKRCISLSCVCDDSRQSIRVHSVFCRQNSWHQKQTSFTVVQGKSSDTARLTMKIRP